MDETNKFKEYRKIRDESIQITQEVLSNLPNHFTMMHLEVLKTVFPEEAEKRLSDLKSKTKLR